MRRMARLAIVDAPLDGSGAGRAEQNAPAARRVREAIAAAAAPFRRADGSYRFENRFRYLITEA